MKIEHTPGPWFVSNAGNGQTQVCGRRNGEICKISSYLYDEDNEPTITELEANARLIAAAPDLLAALQEIANSAPKYPVSNQYAGDSAYSEGYDNALIDLAKTAREALAKITKS